MGQIAQGSQSSPCLSTGVESTIASLYNHFGETPPDHRKSSSSSSSCKMAQNKGNKRKKYHLQRLLILIYLLSSLADVSFQKRIFLRMGPNLPRDYMTLNSWENFTIKLEWHKRRGKKTLGNSTLTWSGITGTGTIILFPNCFNLNFILAYWSTGAESEGLW